MVENKFLMVKFLYVDKGVEDILNIIFKVGLCF